MAIKVNNIILDLNDDDVLIKKYAAQKVNIKEKDINKFKILRRSIDARKKNSIKINYTVELKCENEEKIVFNTTDNDIRLLNDKYTDDFELGTKKLKNRPIIIGMGPAGMFAGLIMAEKGYKPLIFERGENIEDRTAAVEKFWSNGILNSNSNVQFGEGGAGTFSDGKLTTRIKDRRCDYILEKFVEFGAPTEILYDSKPHIGTDILKNVVKNIRNKIIELGGEIRFNSELKDIVIKNNVLKSIIINEEDIECENLILAIGHSSRDTYEMLYRRGISMISKPFAIGVRAEHLQEMINIRQYGKYAHHPKLNAADYRLTYTSKKTNRGVYSFCMCPGGEVVGAASEKGRLVTNGMSNYKREKRNANSAIVVTVNESDFEGSSPLNGIEFQRHYEELAYKAGGGDYKAPVQLLGDLLKDTSSKKIGKIKPTYKPGYKLTNLNKCLPDYVIESIKEAFINFDKKIKGFADYDTILTGIETRTSSPVRIIRNEKFQSISVSKIFPSGEGAGYAGGIVSSAVDGIKVAESIMKEYSPIN